MCYWRRLSKRSVDEFDYEYTSNSSSAIGAKQETNNLQAEPVISDSLNLFKALQVRHESPAISDSTNDAIRSGKLSSGSSRLREVYGDDEDALLVCYRQAEVLIFLSTVGALLTLVVMVAVTCCLRIRKLSSKQYQHTRLKTGSLSPSLLSVSDTISANSGTMVNASGATCHFGSSPLGRGSFFFRAPKCSPQIWSRMPARSPISPQVNHNISRTRLAAGQSVAQCSPGSPSSSSSSSYLSLSSLTNGASFS